MSNNGCFIRTLLLCLPCWFGWGSAAVALQTLTVDQCHLALKEFEEQFWGLEVDIELVKEWDEAGLTASDPRAFEITCHVAQNADGSFSRTLWISSFLYGPDRPANLPKELRFEKETCHFQGQSVQHDRNLADDREQFSGVTGFLNQVTARPMSLDGAFCGPFGLSRWDEMFLSQVIRRANAIETVRADTLDGESATVLSVDPRRLCPQ